MWLAFSFLDTNQNQILINFNKSQFNQNPQFDQIIYRCFYQTQQKYISLKQPNKSCMGNQDSCLQPCLQPFPQHKQYDPNDIEVRKKQQNQINQIRKEPPKEPLEKLPEELPEEPPEEPPKEPPKEPPEEIIYPPDWNSNFKGNGVIQHRGKFIYSGSFTNGVFHGKGQIKFVDKQITFKGEWQNSNPKQGTLTFGNGTTVEIQNFQTRKVHIFYQDGQKYVGQINMKTYQPHGMGDLYKKDGSFSKGQWEDGKLHGKGQQKWRLDNNCTQSYEGSFINGIKNGHGTYRFKDGSYYKGNWKDDKMDGEGTLFNSDNTINKKGIWQEGNIIRKQ